MLGPRQVYMSKQAKTEGNLMARRLQIRGDLGGREIYYEEKKKRNERSYVHTRSQEDQPRTVSQGPLPNLSSTTSGSSTLGLRSKAAFREPISLLPLDFLDNLMFA